MRLPAVQFAVVLGLVPVDEADPPPVGDGGDQGCVRVGHHAELLSLCPVDITRLPVVTH